MKPKLIVYLPVIHQGYLQLFKKYKTADVFIINLSLIELIDREFDYLRKEIRAITPQQAETSLSALLPNRNISLIGVNDLMLLDSVDQTIILPKEDIFAWLAKNYLPKSHVIFEKTFLRWNKDNSEAKNKVSSNTSAPKREFKKLIKIFEKADSASQLSSDWWRQVGAIVFDSSKSGSQPKIISIAHNHHLPSPYTQYIDSDPRNVFHKGENIDLSTAIHAEAALITNCAKTGTALEGKSIYVSTFPCPTCAKLIATSGISQLFYSEGYSLIDGERVLKNAGVKIVKAGGAKKVL